MTHRHEYGEVLSEYFVSKVNSDLTEGRGGMIDRSVFENHLDAYKDIKGKGVQGAGDGDVVLRRYLRCTGCIEILVTNVTIYHGDSYTQNRIKNAPSLYPSFAPDGWLESYSPMMQDPDYKTYLRLKEKFGG